MSPKADSETKVLTRTAWSRDVRPNTSGVTYSRRSYYYDREFSDSIVRPTDSFESFPSGCSIATRYQERGSGFNEEYENISVAPSKLFQNARRTPKRRYDDIPARPLESSGWRFEDPFQRGRVLQTASADDRADDGVYALQDCAPPKPAQEPAAAAATDAEPGLTFAGLDLQTIAQGVVVAADILVRITEAYQRIRDGDGHDGSSEDEGADDEFFGLNLDPYHLEAGPPRRLRSLSKIPPRRTTPAPKTTTRRPLVAIASTTGVASTTDRTRGDASGQSSNATATRSILPPLPAGKRVCYYLIATVVFGVLASFGLALWWTQSQGDASAGFTIGGYVIAVDALIVAIVGVVHRPGCRCWKA
ncbi:hypothetical protein F4801DRAFT_181975 [Xylaria longipes]|nr:hypothetical protein F4801DRAFT_181975 [Xylaria longipes]